jgi:peptidoglycan/LPS O-acetylase OafA/YrhL
LKKWQRRVRGAVGMGLTWAIVWAPVALLIGLIVDPTDSMDEMWPMIGALPGFLGGVVFSAVLGFAANRRKLGDLSIRKVALWGAGAGLIVGVVPFFLGTPAETSRPWLLPTVVISAITLLCAVSAAGSLWLAQRAESRTSKDIGADEGEPELAVGHARELTSSGAYEAATLRRIDRAVVRNRPDDA